jgi:crotonobetainyl-CoA:carnitine CoA-transferase CaiB-like acyl-CoA transferase
MMLVSGISAGLLQRERTGVAPVVDVSLLATAMWQLAPAIVATGMFDMEEVPRPSRARAANPLTIYYKLKDQRFIKLSLHTSDLFYADLCTRLDVTQLIEDPRFATQASRHENSVEFVKLLDEAFGKYSVDDVRNRFDGFKGAWSIVQTPLELQTDPQVVANGYIRRVRSDNSPDFMVVGPPVQFDEQPAPEGRGAPGHGQDTDEVLLELGLDWERIIALKSTGDVL